MRLLALACWGILCGFGILAAETPATDEAKAAKKETPFAGRVAEVTVYTQGRARVTRKGAVDLPTGKTVWVSAPLPAQADPASITVGFAARTGKAVVESVEVRTRPVLPGSLEVLRTHFERERKEQEDALFKARQRLAELDDARKTQEETLELLKTLRASVAETPKTADLQTPVVKVENWAAAIKTASESAARARSELRALAGERREAEAAMAVEQRKLQELGRRAPETVSEVRVLVTLGAAAPASGTLSLDYNVTGATWSPSYRAGADLAAKQIAIDLHGAVAQSTGEDWTDVALRLSTARPDLGIDVPVLKPWYLATGAAAALGKKGGGALLLGNAALTGPQQALLAAPAPEDAAPRSTSVATVFPAEGLARIPSDGQTHRIRLASFTSDFSVVHVAIPKIQPYAFMRAVTTNRAPYPLLPGVVEVNVGDVYVGRGMMRLTAPGEKVRLGLGRDEGVSAEIRPLAEQSERKTRGDRVQSTNAFEIRVANTTAKPVTLSVLDQLPVPTGDELSVTYGTEARKALRGGNFPGQLQWEFDLPPGKAERVEFDFTLDYPEKFREELNDSRNRQLQYSREWVPQAANPAAGVTPMVSDEAVSSFGWSF